MRGVRYTPDHPGIDADTYKHGHDPWNFTAARRMTIERSGFCQVHHRCYHAVVTEGSFRHDRTMTSP
jgi:hypothetical protein